MAAATSPCSQGPADAGFGMLPIRREGYLLFAGLGLPRRQDFALTGSMVEVKILPYYSSVQCLGGEGDRQATSR